MFTSPRDLRDRCRSRQSGPTTPFPNRFGQEPRRSASHLWTFALVVLAGLMFAPVALAAEGEKLFGAAFWTMVIAGAIGGVIFELILLQGHLEWPHKPNPASIPPGLPNATYHRLVDLGFVGRMIIGAAAAVAIHWVLPQEQGIKLIAASVVAGSCGISVFRSLQDRLTAALKDQTLAEANKLLQQAQEGLPELSVGLHAAGKGTGTESLEFVELRGQLKAITALTARP